MNKKINWIDVEPDIEINLWSNPKGDHCFVVSGVDHPEPRPVVRGVLSRAGFSQREVSGQTVFAAFINTKTTQALKSLPGAKVIQKEREEVYIQSISDAVKRFTSPAPTLVDIAEIKESQDQTEERPIQNWFPLHEMMDKQNSSFSRSSFNPASRAEDNMEALRILKEQGGANSLADQSALASYVGWGGLQEVFNEETNTSWALGAGATLRSYVQRGVLSENEYNDMRASVLNAHYTDLAIINGVWSGLLEAGFDGGTIAELGAGVGHFIGMTPPDIAANSEYTAVEREPIAAEIISELYRDVNLEAQPLEATPLKTGGFDLVIGNVPFSELTVPDEVMGARNLALHNYFIGRALEAVKPGGTVAVITSTYTMDSRDSSFRELLYQQASLSGAVRLPVKTMSAMAGTDSSMDLLVFTKRAEPLTQKDMSADSLAYWARSSVVIPEKMIVSGESGDEALYINPAFIDDEFMITPDIEPIDPKTIIVTPGDFKVTSGRFGRTLILDADKESLSLELSISTVVAAAAEHGIKLRKETAKSQASLPSEDDKYVSLPGALSHQPQLFDGSFFEMDGKIAQVVSVFEDGITSKKGMVIDLGEKPYLRIAGMISIRDHMTNTLFHQRHGDFSAAQDSRDALNDTYDAFIKKNGFLGDNANQRIFNSDPSAGRVLSLEKVMQEFDNPIKSDIFLKDIISPPVEVESVDTLQEGLALSQDKYGFVGVVYIAELMGRDPDEVASLLLDEGLAYPDLSGEDNFIESSILLSGDVKTTLSKVDELVQQENGRQWLGLKEQLEAVIPEDITASDIHVRFGSTWLPSGYFNQFLHDRNEDIGLGSLAIKRDEYRGEWTVEIDHSEYEWYQASRAISNEYDVERRSGRAFAGVELLERIINSKPLTINYTSETAEGKKVTMVDSAATALAEEKAIALAVDFQSWLMEEDGQRRDTVVKTYNERFNRTVERVFDGAHLRLPGMADSFVLREHQKNAVWRSVSGEGNTLLAHEVGTGKTAVMFATAMELKRLGKANRPLMVVPNSMLKQIHREASVIYPEANVLAISNEDLKAGNRDKFIGKVINNEWDLIIMTHAMFNRIPVDPEFETQTVEAEVMRLTDVLELEDNKKTVKQIELARQRLEAKITSFNDGGEGRENAVNFSELGVDSLMVDEFHNYKNLEIAEYNSRGGPQGINGSNRAWSMYMKIQSLYEKLGSVSGVVAASGTPVSNNVLEFFVLQRYLQPDKLEEAGMSNFNAWRSTFLQEVTRWEPSPSGTGFAPKQRFVLQNVPEMMGSLRLTMDVVAADNTAIVRPDMDTINVSIDMTELQEECMSELSERVEAMANGGVDPKDDNILKVISDGKKLALSPALWGLEDEGVTKIDAMSREIATIHHENELTSSTQLVFLDLGVPGGSSGYNAYEAIATRLVEQGVDRSQIAFIHDAKTDKAREVLFEKVREGNIRVLIGSTGKMGEGVNVQNRLCAVHHGDAPWRPSDIEQRDGRMLRQGNLHKNVGRYIYTVKDTFDVFTWSVLKNKAEIFVAALHGDPRIRTLDMDGVDPSFAETAALTSGNPFIKEKMELESEINRLHSLLRAFENERAARVRTISNSASDLKSLSEREVAITDVSRIISVDEELYWEADFSDHLSQGEDENDADFNERVLFSGSKDDLLKILAKIYKEQRSNEKIEEIKLSYRGVPVIVEGADSSKLVTLRTWQVPYSQGTTVFKGAVGVELFVDDAELSKDSIKNQQVRIKSVIGEAQEWLANDEGFPRTGELKEAESRLAELNMLIETGESGGGGGDDSGETIKNIEVELE